LVGLASQAQDPLTQDALVDLGGATLRSRPPVAASPYAGDIASTVPTPEPAKRGRPPSLTEEQIVAAALELSAVTPLDQVSMRAVAAHLGVPVMTIYNYVPNKAALHELVQDQILAGVDVPAAGAGAWEERLRTLMRNARAAVSDYAVAGFSAGIAGSAEGTRLADAVRDILEEAGFAPRDLALAFTTLFTFMLGQIEVDALARTAATERTVSLPMPTGSRPPARDGAFDFAFDVLLAGLKTKLPA
jgi:AcrR family transcriptional regulator